jgi:branched-chain amino acid transport system permease protein
LQVLSDLTQWLNQLTVQGVINVPNALSPAKMQRFIFGAILVLIAIFRPYGLITAKNRKEDAAKLQTRSSPGAVPINEKSAPSGGMSP